MSSRPESADAASAAEEIFAGLPAFDVVDGELMPRPAASAAGSDRPAAQ